MSEASPDSRPLSFRAGLDKGLEASIALEAAAETSTAMGIVITDSVTLEAAVEADVGGLTRTILLEVMGEDTTMEDGLLTDVGCSRISGLEAVEAVNRGRFRFSLEEDEQ